MTPPKPVAIYMRVSTRKQNLLTQFMALRREADRRNWKIVAVYRDRKTGRNTKRPGFQKMMADAKRHKFDVILTWSPSRLGRSYVDAVVTIDELGHLGVDIFAIQPSVDTTSRIGRAFFHVASIFLEMQREDIVENINSGLDRARAQGKTLGRPQITDETRQKILKLRAEGKGIRKIASELRTGVSTVQRVLSEAKG